MVEYNKSVVYREDWEFSMDETYDYITDDGYIIQNNDINGDEIYDYIELTDYEQCEALDYALYTIENDLHDLLESRVYVEYRVIADMVEYIQKHWNDGDFKDAIKVVDRIHDGHYDAEMIKYDAFLKANRLLQELHDTPTSDVNNLGEDFQEIARVMDIKGEATKMLANVMVKLKHGERYLNFEEGV